MSHLVLCILLVLAVLPSNVSAQGSATVAGRVLNTADETLIGYATVVIENAQTGASLSGVLTSEDGRGHPTLVFRGETLFGGAVDNEKAYFDPRRGSVKPIGGPGSSQRRPMRTWHVIGLLLVGTHAVAQETRRTQFITTSTSRHNLSQLAGVPRLECRNNQ